MNLTNRVHKLHFVLVHKPSGFIVRFTTFLLHNINLLFDHGVHCQPSQPTLGLAKQTFWVRHKIRDQVSQLQSVLLHKPTCASEE